MPHTIRLSFINTSKLVCLTVLAVFLLNDAAPAQSNNNYFFKYITREDGLIHNNVYDITQDKRCFMWIVTQNGLQCYDGVRFMNFNDMLNNPLQASGTIANIYADNHHNLLWLNNTIGTEEIDVLKNRFINYTSEQLLQQSSKTTQTFIDKDNHLWKKTESGIFYNDSAYHLASFNTYATIPGTSNAFVTDNSTHQTWYGRNVHGLILFDSSTHKVYNTLYNPVHNVILQAFEKKFGSKPYQVSNLMLDKNHNLWVASFGDVFYKFDAATNKLETYSLLSIIQQEKKQPSEIAPASVNGFFQDDHNIVWINTVNAGLLKYNASTNKFDIISAGNRNNNSLLNYNINCIFQDKDEDIWLGTDKGIMLFNPYRQFFQRIRHEENNDASLPKSEIENYIQTTSGDVIVGTWGGGITLFDSNWNFKKNISFNAPFELDMVWCFAQNDDGKIWMGCQHGYIHIYNPSTGSIETIHPAEMNNYTIRCMTKDKAGNIWFGLHNGKITEWSKPENKFYSCNNSADNAQYAFVTKIFFDHKQRCWVSSANGFRQFDTKQRIYTATYLPDIKNSSSVSSGAIKGIEQINDSTLLIGTINGGLNTFNINAKTFAGVKFQNNLPLQNIYAVKKDAAGYVWFTTDYGLYKFKPGNNKLIAYKIERGIINSTFKNTSFYTLQNGEWITSTSTEILRFQPNYTVAVNEDKTPVIITGFKVFDSTIAIDSLLQINQPLYLSYKQNFITVEWAKPEFFSLHQHQFYYRLKGVNKDWVNAEGKYAASYTNLNAGNYTFEVKRDDEASAENTASLNIIIVPPFWKTWWFISFEIICCAALIYLLAKWRIKSFRAVENEKIKVQQAKIEVLSMNEKLSFAKLEALRSQMNPHFIFNCLTSIDNLIQTNEKEKATIYLARFAKLIRSILETSKSNAVPCWKDMETLKIYLEMEELRCDKKFRYVINMSDEILNGDYKVPPLVIQPFVENAIHHGLLNKKEEDKELVIDVWASQNLIHYIIRDNGVGRTKAAAYKQLNKPAHQSMGIQITIDRINLFNQNGQAAVTVTDLYNAQHEAAGTKVEVNLLNQS